LFRFILLLNWSIAGERGGLRLAVYFLEELCRFRSPFNIALAA
jgi:hypothetical protein